MWEYERGIYGYKATWKWDIQVCRKIIGGCTNVSQYERGIYECVEMFLTWISIMQRNKAKTLKRCIIHTLKVHKAEEATNYWKWINDQWTDGPTHPEWRYYWLRSSEPKIGKNQATDSLADWLVQRLSLRAQGLSPREQGLSSREQGLSQRAKGHPLGLRRAVWKNANEWPIRMLSLQTDGWTVGGL